MSICAFFIHDFGLEDQLPLGKAVVETEGTGRASWQRHAVGFRASALNWDWPHPLTVGWPKPHVLAGSSLLAHGVTVNRLQERQETVDGSPGAMQFSCREKGTEQWEQRGGTPYSISATLPLRSPPAAAPAGEYRVLFPSAPVPASLSLC